MFFGWDCTTVHERPQIVACSQFGIQVCGDDAETMERVAGGDADHAEPLGNDPGRIALVKGQREITCPQCPQQIDRPAHPPSFIRSYKGSQTDETRNKSCEEDDQYAD